jgi:asparagine synthase (glutamine-hydrolysing)
MCGIIGWFSRLVTASGTLGDVGARMCDAIKHRGPDALGLWVDESSGLVLGHRRLAIVDLTEAGAQPMTSGSGRWIMVYNGEVYNFQEIRKDLNGDGWRGEWRGHSDSEVILEAIDFWGVSDAVSRFNGMFAMVLWDRRDRRLVFVRDRLGVKPLYVAIAKNDVILFGSELAAITCLSDFPAQLNRAIVPSFLAYGYIPRPECIYQNCFQLIPGTILEMDAANLDVPGLFSQVRQTHHGRFSRFGEGWRYSSYWSIQDVEDHISDHPFRGTFDDAVESAGQLLCDSVRLRLLSDVPLGAFLSGGIDSSLVVSLMRRQFGGAIKTFSIGFEDKEFDESPYAEAIAKHLATQHTTFRVSDRESLAVTQRLPELQSEPLGDSSFVPTFLVSQLTRQEVTVALTGDGGDELFGGYWRYRQFRRLRSVYAGFGFVRRFGGSMNKRLRCDAPGPCSSRSQHLLYKFYRAMTVASRETFHAAYQSAVTAPYDCSALCLQRVSVQAIGASELNRVASDLFWEMTKIDAENVLPDDLLVKVDRASMAVGLECREPLLDYRLVQFTRSLPVEFHVRAHVGKRILRQILYRHVPPSLVDRPKKGFAVPLSRWLKTDLKIWAQDILLGHTRELNGLFNDVEIRRLWDDHQKGKSDHKTILWHLLVIRHWLLSRRWS